MQRTRRNLLRGLALGGAGGLLSPFLRGVVGEAMGQPLPGSLLFIGGWLSFGTQHLHPTLRSSTDFDLNPTMESLKPYVADLSLITGLYSGGLSMNGGHGVMPADFLSGLASPSWDDPQGPTFDRFLARRIGGDSKFSSLHVNLVDGPDDGLSAPPISGIQSWDAAKQPYPPLRDPLEAYQRLFADAVPGSQPGDLEARLAEDRSLLDFVVKDVQRVRSRLASAEAEKLDLYTESLRAIERKLALPSSSNACADLAPPAGGGTFTARAELLVDVAAMALSCGVSRVATVWLNHKNYGGIGLGEDNVHDTIFHALSPRESELQAWRMQQVARAVARTREFGRGDSTLIAYSDPNGDVHHGGQDGQFFILIGKLAGKLKAGQALRFENGKRAVNDVWVSIAQALDVNIETFGDPQHCRGPLSELV